MAQPLPLGPFVTNAWITYDGQAFAAAMQDLIAQGSNNNQIAITDIEAYSADPNQAPFVSIDQAVRAGTKFFDALMYFSIPAPNRPAIVNVGTPPPAARRTPEAVARLLFNLAFYILTRGTVPSTNNTNIGAEIPAILANTFGMNYSPLQLTNWLATFNLRLMNHTWIRHINFAPLTQIARNRFGLGVAGYRMLAPFKIYPAQQTVQHNMNIPLPNMIAAYDTARMLATREYDWNIHSITRSPIVFQTLGALNPNLGNLMLACFTDDQLNQMVTSHMLFAFPTFVPVHQNFVTWTPTMITWAVDAIF